MTDNARQAQQNLQHQLDADHHPSDTVVVRKSDLRQLLTALSSPSPSEQDLVSALERIAEGGDCRCEHDDENCCANVADYCCPQCIAAKALKGLAERSGPHRRKN